MHAVVSKQTMNSDIAFLENHMTKASGKAKSISTVQHNYPQF